MPPEDPQPMQPREKSKVSANYEQPTGAQDNASCSESQEVSFPGMEVKWANSYLSLLASCAPYSVISKATLGLGFLCEALHSVRRGVSL